eukprot:Clim_evm1s17 gene=Clim_evmTU1s17
MADGLGFTGQLALAALAGIGIGVMSMRLAQSQGPSNEHLVVLKDIAKNLAEINKNMSSGAAKTNGIAIGAAKAAVGAGETGDYQQFHDASNMDMFDQSGAQIGDNDAVKDEADRMRETGDYNECFQLLVKTYEATDAEDCGLMWRIARAYYDMAENETDRENKKFYTEKGLEWAEQALENGDNDADCHLWFAVMRQRNSEFYGPKERIEEAFVFKEHALKALELNDQHYLAYHLLGRWCFEISNMTWLERRAASALFGTPPTSTYEEAKEYFEKCDSIRDTWKLNKYWLAKSCISINDKPGARAVLQEACRTPADSAEDSQPLRDCEALLQTV